MILHSLTYAEKSHPLQMSVLSLKKSRLPGIFAEPNRAKYSVTETGHKSVGTPATKRGDRVDHARFNLSADMATTSRALQLATTLSCITI